MRIGPLGIWEILAIAVVTLLVFGPRRLPEMAKGIGQSVREFRKGVRDLKDDFALDDKPKKATSSAASPVVPQVSASVAAPEPAAAAETTKEPVGAV